MRLIKFMALLMLVSTAGLVMAELNQYGVAETQTLTFSDPIKVGDVVLPQGEYRVQHKMEGENHLMVFTQLRVSRPVEARAKCELVKLPSKADRTEVIYLLNDGSVHVLREITFRGDTAKHVF